MTDRTKQVGRWKSRPAVWPQMLDGDVWTAVLLTDNEVNATRVAVDVGVWLYVFDARHPAARLLLNGVDIQSLRDEAYIGQGIVHVTEPGSYLELVVMDDEYARVDAWLSLYEIRP